MKKDDNHEWKKIMNDDKISEEEKYRQLMKKAEVMENRAKKNEDKVLKKEADE
jgi:hypothetical protein